MLLQFRGDRDRLTGQQGRDPIRRPGAVAGIVDPRQRLEGDGFGDVVGQRAAEVVPVAAHRQCGGADRAAEIEGEDLGAGIAAELERHQRQQHALAGAGRAHDQRMADIADMQREPERGGAFRSREEQRRPAKMLIPFRPGPDGRERHHVGEVERRDRRLADIGVDVAGQDCRARPRSRSPSRACR